mmetsp:Transcript_37728/g.90264  ORF Transcript_37728/g.90264 Transcript_37728/m.90264 type:complete len:327 (-) Transcript_37728:676-1656(-)
MESPVDTQPPRGLRLLLVLRRPHRGGAAALPNRETRRPRTVGGAGRGRPRGRVGRLGVPPAPRARQAVHGRRVRCAAPQRTPRRCALRARSGVRLARRGDVRVAPRGGRRRGPRWGPPGVQLRLPRGAVRPPPLLRVGVLRPDRPRDAQDRARDAQGRGQPVHDDAGTGGEVRRADRRGSHGHGLRRADRVRRRLAALAVRRGVRPGVGREDLVAQGRRGRQAGLEAAVAGEGRRRLGRLVVVVVGPAGEEEELPQPPAARQGVHVPLGAALRQAFFLDRRVQVEARGPEGHRAEPHRGRERRQVHAVGQGRRARVGAQGRRKRYR